MTTLGLRLLFSGVISCLITLYVIPLCIKLASNLGVTDTPDGVIKRHERVTPYLGGLGVFIGLLAGLDLALPFDNKMFSLFVGATLLMFVGLLDDVMALAPYQKLAGQGFAALSFMKGGLFLKEQFFQTHWLIGIPFSFLWILTVTNAFNLVDVMDGLTSVISIGAATSFLMVALLWGQPVPALVCAALIGALVGFLWYNRPVAQIYLGDAGSLFLGGLFATMPFLISWREQNAWGLLAPCIILAIPLLELGTLIVIRTAKGIPFYKASPDHFAIYLRRQGWSVWQVLIYVMGINSVLTTVTYAFVTELIGLPGLLASGALGLVVWFSILFRPGR